MGVPSERTRGMKIFVTPTNAAQQPSSTDLSQALTGSHVPVQLSTSAVATWPGWRSHPPELPELSPPLNL